MDLMETKMILLAGCVLIITISTVFCIWLNKRILTHSNKKEKTFYTFFIFSACAFIVIGLIYKIEFLTAYTLASLMVVLQQIQSDKSTKILNADIKSLNTKLDDILTRVPRVQCSSINNDRTPNEINKYIELNKITLLTSDETSINATNSSKNNILIGLVLVSLIALFSTKTVKTKK